MRTYDWSRKGTVEKVWIYVASWSFFIAWIYFSVGVSAHRFPTMWEFGHVVWNMFKGLLFVSIFPAAFMIFMLIAGKKNGYKRKHHFYQDWATVYTGYGKHGGRVSFFFEDIAALQIRPASYAGEPFYLATVRLKATLNYLGKERDVKIGLRAEATELQRLLDWAKGHQINVTLGEAPFHRRF